jgi:hypothetical protein
MSHKVSRVGRRSSQAPTGATCCPSPLTVLIWDFSDVAIDVCRCCNRCLPMLHHRSLHIAMYVAQILQYLSFRGPARSSLSGSHWQPGIGGAGRVRCRDQWHGSSQAVRAIASRGQGRSREAGERVRWPPLLPSATMNEVFGHGRSNNRFQCMLQEYVLGVPEVLGNVASVSCRCCKSGTRCCNVAKVDLDVANVVFECCGCYFLMFWNSSPCCCSTT